MYIYIYIYKYIYVYIYIYIFIYILVVNLFKKTLNLNYFCWLCYCCPYYCGNNFRNCCCNLGFSYYHCQQQKLQQKHYSSN